MIDLKLLRQNPDFFKDALRKKRVAGVDIGKILKLDEAVRKNQLEIESLRAKQNKFSKEKPDAKMIGGLKRIKWQIDELKNNLKNYTDKLEKMLSLIPNPPLPDVPDGGENDFKVLREWGEKPKFNFKPREYTELAATYDLIDTERAAKISGSRFGYIKNEAALLEFALIKFTIDQLMTRGFRMIAPPVLIRPEYMRAMGYTERGSEEIYHIEKDDLYLVGTSEQSIGPMHADEILSEEALPLRYLAFSTCFRREAGSYGKDTKGILRVHQFDKLEMVSFTKQEDSKNEHLFLLETEEMLMQKLGIPYRVLQIAAGDLGDPAAAKFDIEAWLPGQKNKEGEYRETHSTSNTTDFQARRLNVRYREEIDASDEKQKSVLKFTHILNGTALAFGRIIIAILENYQQKDGIVKIPYALIPYLGFDQIPHG